MSNSWQELELAILIGSHQHPQSNDPYCMVCDSVLSFNIDIIILFRSNRLISLILYVPIPKGGRRRSMFFSIRTKYSPTISSLFFQILAKYTSLDILIGWIRYGNYKNEDLSIHQFLYDQLHPILFDEQAPIYDPSKALLTKKFCVFLCMILQYDYPTLWKDPFNVFSTIDPSVSHLQELYSFCHDSVPKCSLYIYILTYINEEIGCSKDSDMYRTIKDQLRKQGLQDIWNHLYLVFSSSISIE